MQSFYSKKLGWSCAVALGLSLSATVTIHDVNAQSRPSQASKIIMDDGSGHTMLITPPIPLPAYNLNPTITFGVPPAGNPPAGFVNVGTLNQMLRWDGTSWVSSGAILNDNSTISIGAPLNSAVRFYLSGSSTSSTAAALNAVNLAGSSELYARNDGHVGIGTNGPASTLSVNGNATIGSTYATVTGPSNGLATEGNVGIATSSPASQLGVNGNMSIGSGYNNTAAPSDGMIIQGNVGIGNTNPGIPLNVETQSGFAARLTGNGDVVRLQSSNMTNNSSLTYVSFIDGNGKTRGSITGQDAVDYISDPQNVIDVALMVAYGVALAVSETEAGEAIQMAAAIIALGIKQGVKASQIGVSYNSSSGDYAEYLPKLDPKETLAPGDVVGVVGGKISKHTDGATLLMAVSTAPIVVGNVPAEASKADFAKVGFLGQVPVHVTGAVTAGDFVVASGKNDGTAVGVHPANMTTANYANLIGRAWSSAFTKGSSYVNVAVGLNADKAIRSTVKQDAELTSMKADLNDLQSSDSRLDAISKRLTKLKNTLGNRSNAKGLPTVVPTMTVTQQ